ncbi:MAG: hypothetical protein AAF358_11440 [Pseudomonadota bacterium]
MIAPLLFAGLVPSLGAEEGNLMPSVFDYDRVLVTPTLMNGDSLRFYTDSGGGFNAIKRSVADKLGAASASEVIDLPSFVDGSSIPANPIFKNGQLQVVEDDVLSQHYDGFLGGRWFGNRIWEFDYETKRLILHDKLPIAVTEPMAGLSLGFQVGEDRLRTMHFPRLPVSIDGKEIQVLFDTGATATLTDSSADYFDRAAGDGIGISFMCQEVFDQWRSDHPDWPYLERADAVGRGKLPMIQVAEVEMAGLVSGPVWFAKRPNSAFKRYMTQFMDQEVCGAIGGSALKYFHLVIDYPAANLWLRLTD